MKAFENAATYKKHYEDLLYHAEENGLPCEQPEPHPDHIEIDYETATFSINGPNDRKGINIWKAQINRMVGMEVELDTSSASHGETVDDTVASDFLKEDRELTQTLLNKFRQIIPETDPLWRKFAPQFRRNWIDHIYYYGPDPHIDEEWLLHEEQSGTKEEGYSSQLEPIEFTPEERDCLENYREKRDEFRDYVREKLEEIMGEKWGKRLDSRVHKRRDIALDKMRYEYDCGLFDQNNYELGPGEDGLFRSEAFLEIYMSWLPDKQREKDIADYWQEVLAQYS